ncbi:AMP-binding protein [Stenotrophomonas panacihumi]|uniref:Long-chain-fatty-acid--CoA ligase n=1 Tax=Stenotrophomonas panacihumi TaxID=676599 RepID=A0A0R0AVP7_9GAMM|nr:AMP-binding protein [Stenotrophomonas panacihumi]KRG46122.1 AMP-binding protein [Stenotrophomonas panacihumi]PTN56498.1 AMP-binding protein [Stenotrophomonas panacihumi]
MAEWIALDRLALAEAPARAVRPGLAHAAWRQRVADWHAAFAAASGEDWALYLADEAEFSAALFGAWHAGKRVFLPGDDLPGTLDRLAAHVHGFAGDLPATVKPLRATPGAGDAQALRALDEEAARLVMFTSGSTGEPAAIAKCLRQLAREVEALQAAFGELAQGARVHGTVSHQHIYGLLFRVLWPLAAGRETMPRAFFHEDMVAAMAGHDALLVATPAHLKRIPEQLDWAALQGRLRAVFSSGGPLPADSAHDVRQRLGVAPTEVFGSSETGGIAWRRWEAEAPHWHPLPNVQWRIDGEGHLEVHSPHLAQPHWWRSEDRAEALPDGGFRLLGRADRIVKIEERRVSLDALQQQLVQHPGVAEARVLVLAGARSVLGAVIVPNDAGWAALRGPGRREFSRQLSAHLADSFDAVTRPRRWRFVEALPLNAQGKVTEPALAKLFRPAYPQPQWQARGSEAAELDILLDPSLAAFDGHFPQAAILPGVAQLDWAIHFGREAFAIEAPFQRMDVLKFQRVLRPGDQVRMSLQWNATQQVLAFRLVSDHGPHASGKVVFGHA